MNKLIYLSVFCQFFFLLSCEEVIDPSVLLKPKPQLLVINGVISPQDKEVKVQVSRSISLVEAINTKGNAKNPIVSNAKVFINEKNKAPVQLNYSNEKSNYIATPEQLKIVAGKQYFLRVEVDNKIYTSSCRIPTNKVDDLQGELKRQNNKNSLSETIKISITDIPKQDNYYVFGALYENNGTAPSFELPSDQFISDKLIDGEKISTNVILVDNLIIDSEVFDDSSLNPKATIQVANVEETLYDSLRISTLNIDNEGDFFIDQAIPPSNIIGENSYGIFAGFQITEREIQLIR